MPQEAAPSGRCLICAEPLDQANETLFKGYCHERCLPNCAQCGLSVEVHSCARIWREPDREWKALHTSPCPEKYEHTRAEQERPQLQHQILEKVVKNGGSNPLARRCLMIVGFVVALGLLVFLIKFFWELF
jgi:hypothetical protein